MPPAVVLVHGLRTSATMWRQQIEDLAESGVSVRAIDLPGHGSRLGERFTISAALDAIGAAVADAASDTGERPYLVGFSLGGYLSIEWVATHPGRVSGLLAASCGTVPNRLTLGVWRLLAKAIHALPDRGRALNDFFVAAFIPQPGARDVLAGGVALEVMDDVLRDMRVLHPVRSLAQVEVPVLFVNGRYDHIRWHAARYLAATKRGRLITVPRATHMVSVTHPNQFTAALREGYSAAAGTSHDRAAG